MVVDSLLPSVESVVDRPQQGELGAVTHSQEVVRINRPGHHPCQPLVIGELRLEGNRALIVKTKPTVSPETPKRQSNPVTCLLVECNLIKMPSKDIAALGPS